MKANQANTDASLKEISARLEAKIEANQVKMDDRQEEMKA
jgi:hypothetical protein